MPRVGQLNPRFLGWREWTPITPTGAGGFEGDGKDVFNVTADRGWLEPVPAPLRQAIWSDEDAMVETDGFDFGRWRQECRFGTMTLGGAKSSSKRPRPAKWVPGALMTIQSPISPSGTGTMRGLPALVTGTSNLMGPDGTPKAGCTSPSSRSTLRSIYGGFKASQLPPISPSGEGPSVPPSTSSCTSPRTSPRAPSLSGCDAADLSEIATSRHDPSTKMACRSDFVELVVERDRRLAEEAKRRRERTDKMVHGTRRVVHRKQMVEPESPTNSANKGIRSEESSRRLSVVSPNEEEDVGGDVDAVEAARARRLRTVITRIQAGAKLRGLASMVVLPEKDGPMGGFMGMLGKARKTEVFMAEASEDQGARSLEDTSDNEVVAVMRSRMRKVILSGMLERKRRNKRQAKVRQRRRQLFLDIPEGERQVMTDMFNLYAGPGKVRPGRMEVTYTSALKGLVELGLYGETAQEQEVVGEAVHHLMAELCLAEEGEVSTAPSAVRPGAEGTSDAPVDDCPRRVRLWDNPGPHSHLGISLEDFCTEIVPLARRVLFEERMDIHCEYFLEVAERARSRNMSWAQMVQLVERLGLNASFLPQALAEWTRKSRGPALDTKAAAQAARNSEQAQKLANKKDAGPALDFEAMHAVLSYVEEHSARARRATERDIRGKSNLNDAMYWEYRGELLKLFETYNYFDLDHSGFLSHDEAKMLMKRIGLQPYVPANSAAVNKFLREADTDGNSEIDFAEFVALLNMVRQHQKKLRQSKLLMHFQRCDENKSGRLEPKELVACLHTAGLVPRRSDQEKALAMAEEHDSERAGGIAFADLEELTQRIVETIFAEANDQNMQASKSLGFDPVRTAEFQVAFDRFDEDGSGSLSVEEIAGALRGLIVRAPSAQEVAQIYYQIDENNDGMVTFPEFLHLMRIVSEGKGLFAQDQPFTLRSIQQDKLRDVLRVFPLSETYILNLDAHELLENVSNFTGYGADQNLKELPKPIRNARQLLDQVKKQEREKKIARQV